MSKYRFPSPPVQFPILRINGTTLSITDLSTAHHQVALTPESLKLVHFVVGKKQYKYKQGFFGLEALPGFFTCVMTILFARSLKWTYIDDILIQVDTKTQNCCQFRNFREN